jgi:hypothetical protein
MEEIILFIDFFRTSVTGLARYRKSDSTESL